MLVYGVDTTKYLKELREKGFAQCLSCNAGTVRPFGKGAKESAHVFICDKCKFRINTD